MAGLLLRYVLSPRDPCQFSHRQLGPFMSLSGFARGIVLLVIVPRM
jgi:hypothetical protein